MESFEFIIAVRGSASTGADRAALPTASFRAPGSGRASLSEVRRSRRREVLAAALPSYLGTRSRGGRCLGVPPSRRPVSKHSRRSAQRENSHHDTHVPPRAPNRYLGQAHHQSAEAEHWQSRIPDRRAHNELTNFFPARIHSSQNNGQVLDIGREPFGFLTHRGMQQMRDVGRSFRKRYDELAHQSTFGSNGLSTFDERWEIEAYSTNYLRTIMSEDQLYLKHSNGCAIFSDSQYCSSGAQCFLDGLISNPNSHTDDRNSRPGVYYAGGGLTRYYLDQGRFKTLAEKVCTTSQDLDSTVSIQVRDKVSDTLNAFDKHPTRMDNLVRGVIAKPSFQRIDGDAKSLADQLCEFLPGLRGAPPGVRGNTERRQLDTRSERPRLCNDHFICRSAHSLPLLGFSDHEGSPDEVELDRVLRSLATPVCSHLAWRFREWYTCPKLLAAISAPPLWEMTSSMFEARAMKPNDKKPFILYSCHDVTLLALLYAIGAEFLVDGSDCGGSKMEDDEGSMSSIDIDDGMVGVDSRKSWRWWPAYSSTIAFELVRQSERDEHFVRVILNGKAISLKPRMEVYDSDSRQVVGRNSSSCARMLRLADLEHLLEVLERKADIGESTSRREYDPPNECASIGVDGG
ncbi:hypothetical protein THAOC_33454 [Thalassiosira oceanica]|uniref:Histidine acid phosphatase n=1 Tax=Thalassiosira oceanica TaxID=159749 RepID=K0RFT6_THAOC|nr:hypothetical protein THAOC_33454 [Thalassiosira oceanica]|eukprot:EJK47811.1 hypothetical protein THAOC_33454 [Thalassiosira oceanica]